MPPSFSTLRVPSALLTDAYGLAVAAVKQSLCRASVMPGAQSYCGVLAG